ncbi:hypothetical protein L227DRAFT_256585 [Lentinus tigrinus ALCF2SS1-6]|uniref:Uncharacterized protein n=1 Tax=Lentinus tigrinus ALCF2SS1-6 TaxID=1328759 RepID=A0A5C2RZ52_9APHY|nr:hypothetical protein L227DRAFT_256585 [Lentinus tigrinus ALCF2SS1-6]
MLPAALADTRPTHLDVAATWRRMLLSWGYHAVDVVNEMETLSVPRACAGAAGASVTHLIVDVPVPEMLQNRVLVELCDILRALPCTHLCVRVPVQLIEDARGPQYCASLLSQVKERLEDYATLVAQASPTLGIVAFHLGVTLRAWSISRPGGWGWCTVEGNARTGCLGDGSWREAIRASD